MSSLHKKNFYSPVILVSLIFNILFTKGLRLESCVTLKHAQSIHITEIYQKTQTSIIPSKSLITDLQSINYLHFPRFSNTLLLCSREIMSPQNSEQGTLFSWSWFLSISVYTFNFICIFTRYIYFLLMSQSSLKQEKTVAEDKAICKMALYLIEFSFWFMISNNYSWENKKETYKHIIIFKRGEIFQSTYHRETCKLIQVLFKIVSSLSASALQIYSLL